jgi:hypothetical protein
MHVPPIFYLLRCALVVGAGLVGGCAGGASSPADVAATSSAARIAAPEIPVASSPARRDAQSHVVPTRPAAARDAYVLLSGGGTPLTNNYSQYLQARAIAAFFERECPAGATWVFFGIGNRDGAPPVLADVLREQKRDGLVLQSWLPGVLKNNRPATRESFLRALRDEILPTVRGGGTLYLFVGDHGELAGKDEQAESAITLWQLQRGRRRGRAWITDEKEILGVAELRRVLAEGLGAGRVVFCMTQCHSGGFHELGIAREPLPPRDWFAAAPSWLASSRRAVRSLPIAGFTATDQQSPAAGCDADPDPERWAGYERYLPESLFGKDLMSGRELTRPAVSLAEAHATATLVDHTIDKPRATSERFLETWAHLIETRLADSPQLTAAAAEAVEAFEQAVNTGRIITTDPALRERQAEFERFTRQLAVDVPGASELLRTGTREQLEGALRARERSGGGRGGRRNAMSELRRTWTQTLRPAWKAAVLNGSVAGLAGPALEFEKHLLALEDDGRDFLLPRGGNDTPLVNEMYWESSYAEPIRFNAAKAAAVTRWGADRRARIVAWGRGSPSPAVRAAANEIGPGPSITDDPPRPMTRRTAVERVLFYRRVLAAWEFLLRLHAEAPLAELRALIELERTPLRPGK